MLPSSQRDNHWNKKAPQMRGFFCSNEHLRSGDAGISIADSALSLQTPHRGVCDAPAPVLKEMTREATRRIASRCFAPGRLRRSGPSSLRASPETAGGTGWWAGCVRLAGLESGNRLRFMQLPIFAGRDSGYFLEGAEKVGVAGEAQNLLRFGDGLAFAEE